MEYSMCLLHHKIRAAFLFLQHYNGSLAVISVLYLRVIFHITAKRRITSEFFFYARAVPVDKNSTLDTIGIGI